MFSVLVSADEVAWESEQRMSMQVGRFGEFSGDEAENLDYRNPETLVALEHTQAILMYENLGPGGKL